MHDDATITHVFFNLFTSDSLIIAKNGTSHINSQVVRLTRYQYQTGELSACRHNHPMDATRQIHEHDIFHDAVQSFQRTESHPSMLDDEEGLSSGALIACGGSSEIGRAMY